VSWSKIAVIKVERNEDDTIRYVKYARTVGDTVLLQKAVIARIGGIPVLVTLEKRRDCSQLGITLVTPIEEADLVSLPSGRIQTNFQYAKYVTGSEGECSPESHRALWATLPLSFFFTRAPTCILTSKNVTLPRRYGSDSI
jgi:hypothetical protein